MRPDEASASPWGILRLRTRWRTGTAARLALAAAGLALGLVGFLGTLVDAHDVAAVPVREWLGLAATLVATAAAWRRWALLLLVAAFAHNVSQSVPVLFGALCFFGASLVTWFSSRRVRRAASGDAAARGGLVAPDSVRPAPLPRTDRAPARAAEQVVRR